MFTIRFVHAGILHKEGVINKGTVHFITEILQSLVEL